MLGSFLSGGAESAGSLGSLAYMGEIKMRKGRTLPGFSDLSRLDDGRSSVCPRSGPVVGRYAQNRSPPEEPQHPRRLRQFSIRGKILRHTSVV